MNEFQRTGVPPAHLTAEIAAFPVVSETAFELAFTTLDSRLAGATARLWRAAERHLLLNVPGLSVDRLLAMRDAVWFGDAPRMRIPLAAYLTGYHSGHVGSASSLFDRTVNTERNGSGRHAGNGTVQSVSDAVLRNRTRWLVRAIPRDLTEPLAARHDRAPAVTGQLFHRLEKRGYAETHLHLGAALEFDALWIGLLARLSDPTAHPDELASPGAPFADGTKFASWILRASIVRLLVAQYLMSASSASFRVFLETTCGGSIRRVAGITGVRAAAQCLGDIVTGKLSGDATADFVALQWVYGRLSRSYLRHRKADSLADVVRMDPLAKMLAGPSSLEWPEQSLVRRSLLYLTGPGRGDRFFATAFWQIQRLRCLYYRHVTQRPMTPGLQWFIRHYARLKPGRTWLSKKFQMASAAHQAGTGKGLRSLEVRVSPESDAASQAELVASLREGIAQVWRDSAADCEIGAVFHLTKDRGGGSIEGHPRRAWIDSHADPGSPQNRTSGYRYAQFYRQKEAEAQAFCSELQRDPQSIAMIRGVDVCTDELGVPNWVLLPLVQRMRAAARVAARRVAGATDPVRFYSTAHVGEGFVHILTGLRNIALTVDHFPLIEGDRLGHGMAIGVPVAKWCAGTGRVAMPAEERLLDLVWARNVSVQSADASSAEISRIEDEIHLLAEQIFGSVAGRTPGIRWLLGLLRDVHDPRLLELAGFPNDRWRLPADERRFEILKRYLTDRETFLRGRSPVWVDVSSEVNLIERLQAELRNRISKRGIAIEINPSSNLLIGDLGSLTDHPFWRMHPPERMETNERIPVCIGSDDPLVFTTSTRQEYQFAYDALVASGMAAESSLDWIDRVRETGLDFRFTLPVEQIRPWVDGLSSAAVRRLALPVGGRKLTWSMRP